MGVGGNGAVSAEFEWHLIKARTDGGVKAARARGVRFGRPLKLTRRSRGKRQSSGLLMAKAGLT
jgi:DNA invertase Pin-like site-specific DNA recombinase